MSRCRITVLASILTALLVGCGSPPEYPRPVVMLTPPAPPPLLPPNRRQNIWHPDEVAPYALGRYIDPHDRNLVHEAHTVYRREQSSRPNLTPPATAVFPLGEAAATSATNAVLFFRDAFTAELNQQRAVSQAIIEQSQQLLKNVRVLNDRAESLHQSAEEAARIRTQWQSLTSRLDQLEHRLRETEVQAPAPTPPTGKWFRP